MSTLTAAARVAVLSLGLASGMVFGTGCNDHPIGGYDDGPQITERGISVPVPPPSLTAAPVQRVEIEGELGYSNPEAGTRVFVLDEGGAGSFTFPGADGSFRFEGMNAVEIDLTMNCLEVWSEEPGDGQMSIHSFFRVSIDEDDQSLVTEQFFSGCGG